MVVFIAAGCTKTTIQNEFQKTMDFSVQSGKLTRAIVQNGDAGPGSYYTNQNFGVFAFGYQTIQGTTSAADPIMSDVMIKYYPGTEASGEISATPAVWKAAENEAVYFWPNDPRTVINFYAYSPASIAKNAAAPMHQQLNGAVSCDVVADDNVHDGIAVTGYEHSNMYVDFMVAEPVIGATYTNPNGGTTTDDVDEDDYGKVPVVFAHKMTQIVFKVKPSQDYSGVTFTVNSIKLNNIKNKGDYNVSAANAWTTTSNDVNAENDYVIFPAKMISENTPNGAPGLTADEVATVITTNDVLVTKPVTMIPQTLAADAQSFTIEYTIAGNNVANETVVKNIDFISVTTASSEAIDWAPNKKITYILNIGLHEITFEPEVDVWDTIVDSGDINI